MPGRILCPSAPIKEGAILLGIVNGEARVDFLPERWEVDEDFVKAALEGRSPERRFRFGAKCAQSGCAQWKGNRCSVIDQVMAAPGAARSEARTEELPACSIRSQCRWHQQHGVEACYACPGVITNCMPDEV